MKTKIATALSIVGVLGAGSAAALVNTQILDSGPTDSGASAAVLPPASSIELTVPTTATSIASAIDDTSTSTTVARSTSTTTVADAVAPAASGYLTAFNVGDAGVVTVDLIDGRLLLVSAEPGTGWTVTKAEDDTNDDSDEVEDEIEVHFSSSTVRVEFEAHIVDGRIVPEVESVSIGGGAGTSANTVPSDTTTDTVRGDDDHDDDRGDDDDHDDDRDDDHDDDDHEDDDRDDDHDDDDHEDDDRDDD